jgi:predicted amidophosphoribosyltransferase
LRRRAMGLIVQLDASTGYREQIEREIAAQVTTPAPAPEHSTRAGTCPDCGTHNDFDARFCKQCGTSLKS